MVIYWVTLCVRFLQLRRGVLGVIPGNKLINPAHKKYLYSNNLYLSTINGYKTKMKCMAKQPNMVKRANSPPYKQFHIPNNIIL